MTDGTIDLITYDAYVLRLNVAILEYACLWSSSEEAYPIVGSNLHRALREFLAYTLAVHLNVSLPDTLDTIETNDMKSSCRFAWNEAEQEFSSSIDS